MLLSPSSDRAGDNERDSKWLLSFEAAECRSCLASIELAQVRQRGTIATISRLHTGKAALPVQSRYPLLKKETAEEPGRGERTSQPDETRLKQC
jgi:hypothetical protein